MVLSIRRLPLLSMGINGLILRAGSLDFQPAAPEVITGGL